MYFCRKENFNGEGQRHHHLARGRTRGRGTTRRLFLILKRTSSRSWRRVACTAATMPSGARPAALHAAQVAIANARRAIRYWHRRTRRLSALRRLEAIACAACLSIRMALALYWSFDVVWKIWRNQPFVLAARHRRRNHHPFRMALARWRRHTQSWSDLDTATFEVNSLIRRRRHAQLLYPYLQRWRLRTQREMASALLEHRVARGRARRALRSLRSSARMRTADVAGRHAARAVATALALRSWFCGIVWARQMRPLLRRAVIHVSGYALIRWRSSAAWRRVGSMLHRAADSRISCRRQQVGWKHLVIAVGQQRTVQAARVVASASADSHLITSSIRRAVSVWAHNARNPWRQAALRHPSLISTPRVSFEVPPPVIVPADVQPPVLVPALAATPEVAIRRHHKMSDPYAPMVAVLSPLVHRLGSLLSKRRVVYYCLACWRTMARVERALIRLPYAGRGRVHADVSISLGRWLRHVVQRNGACRLADFARRSSRRRTLALAWRAVRRAARWHSWPAVVTKAIVHRRGLVAMRQWRTACLAAQRRLLIRHLALQGQRLSFRRVLIRWARRHDDTLQDMRRAELRSAAAERLFAFTTRRVGLRRWRRAHVRAVRALFLPAPPMPPPPAPPHLRGEATRAASGDGDAADDTEMAAPRPPSVHPSPARGGYNSRRLQARLGGIEVPLKVAVRKRRREGSKVIEHSETRLEKLRRRHDLTFRYLWDGRQACRRWDAATQLQRYLARRRAAAMHVATEHAAGRELVAARLRVLHVLRTWHIRLSRRATLSRVATSHAALAGYHATRDTRRALQAWVAGVRDVRLGAFAHMHAVALHAPRAPSPDLAASHKLVAIARAVHTLRRHALRCILHRARADAHRMAEHPFRRSFMRHFLHRLRLSASTCPRTCDAVRIYRSVEAALARGGVSAVAARSALLYSLTRWLVVAHMGSLTNTLFATADAAHDMHLFTAAFDTWRSYTLDQSLGTITIALEASAALAMCSRAFDTWRAFGVQVVIALRLWDSALHEDMHRAWREWARHAATIRHLAIAEGQGATRSLRYSMGIWSIAAKTAADGALAVAIADKMRQKTRVRGALRVLQLLAVSDALASAAVAQGVQRRFVAAWRHLHVFTSRRAWASHVAARGARNTLRIALQAWHEHARRLASPSLVRVRRADRCRVAQRTWRVLAVAFDALVDEADRHHAVASSLQRHAILTCRRVLRLWCAWGEEQMQIVDETNQMYALAEVLRCRRHLHRFAIAAAERRIRCTNADLLQRSHIQRVWARTLREWWPGCTAAATATSARAGAVHAGVTRSALRRWRSHASFRAHSLNALALAGQYASTVCARRLVLRTWRVQVHTRLARDTLLSQRARLVQISCSIAWAVARWHSSLVAGRRARMPWLVLGWIGWRRGQRLRVATFARCMVADGMRARRGIMHVCAVWRRLAATRDRDEWQRRRRRKFTIATRYARRRYEYAMIKWQDVNIRERLLRVTPHIHARERHRRILNARLRSWRQHALARRAAHAMWTSAVGRAYLDTFRQGMSGWRRGLKAQRTSRAEKDRCMRLLAMAAAAAAAPDVAAGRTHDALAKSMHVWQWVARRARRLSRATSRPGRTPKKPTGSSPNPMLRAAAEAGRLRAQRALHPPPINDRRRSAQPKLVGAATEEVGAVPIASWCVQLQPRGQHVPLAQPLAPVYDVERHDRDRRAVHARHVENELRASSARGPPRGESRGPRVRPAW